MPIDPLPTPPTTSDPANFDFRADAFVLALVLFVTQANLLEGNVETKWQQAVDAAAAALASASAAAGSASNAEAFAAVAIGATNYVSESGSTVDVAAGERTFALSSAVSASMATVDAVVIAIRLGDPETRVSGKVKSGSTTTNLILDVPSEGVVGTGAHSDWFVMLAAFAGVGATKADMLAVTSSQAAVTPLAIKEALEPFALTDGPTVTPNGLNGLDFTWTIGGNRTLGAITNTYRGATGTITITQDGTGGRVLAWASSVWKRQGGLPVLPTAAGAKAHLEYKVRAVDGGNTATDITIIGFSKAPTN